MLTRSVDARWTVVAAVAAAALTVIAGSIVHSWRPFVLLTMVAVVGANFYVLRKATNQPVPFAAVVGGVFVIIGTTGYFFYPAVQGEALVSAIIPPTADYYNAAAQAFALAAAGLFIGGLIGSIATRDANVGGVSSAALEVIRRLNAIPAGLAAVLFALPAIAVTVGISPKGVLYRANYLAAYGPHILDKLASSVLPIGLTAGALLMFRPVGYAGRLRGLALVSAYFLLTFAKGTRLLGVFPLVLFGCYLLQRRAAGAARPTVAVIVMAVAGTLFCLNLPLAVRTANQPAGLIPYTQTVVSEPGRFLQPHVGAITGNVLFAVPLTGLVSQSTNVTGHDIVTSINPLPGGLTDWPKILPRLRVNRNTPFNALGELYNVGPGALFAYFFAAGLILTRLQAAAASLEPLQAMTITVALGGLTLLFSISLLQYNLRAGTRQLWYGIALYTVARLLSRRGKFPHGPTTGLR